MTQSSAPAHVLIVDDDVALAHALGRAVNHEGRIIGFAHDASTACRLVRERAFDVLVCDYELPDGDGSMVLRCALEAQPNTPRILLTGHSQWEVAKQAVNSGEVLRVLEKPCDAASFRVAVDAALERKRGHDGRREIERIGDDYRRELARVNGQLETQCAEQAIALHRQRRELAEALLHAAEMRAPGVRRRAREVEALTARLAIAARLDATGFFDLQAASLLHEIGVVSLDDRQLRESSLAMDDRSLQIEQASASILEHVNGLHGAARLIRLVRHARAGEPVAVGARILALALRYRALSVRFPAGRVRATLEREAERTNDAALVAPLFIEPS